MTPRFSIVTSARNDNYGGNFLHRMQVFVDVLAALCQRESLRAELIVVEWNPPADKPRLREAIRWPEGALSRATRIIEVPPELHRQFTNWQKMPMFEYIAKNAGIRRAVGDFILSTNPDIVFCQKMIRDFAGNLDPNASYRADRYDVVEQVPLGVPVDRQLALCAKHSVRVHKMEGSYPVQFPDRARAWLATNLPRLAPGRVVRGVRRRLGAASPQPAGPPSAASRYTVHTNASGDFFLMSAKRWQALRAFPQLVTHSHIDSYLVYLAAVSGMPQIILPDPIYHQEHDRSEQAQRPLTVLEKIPEFREMLETGVPKITNDADWGLGNAELPETRPAPAARAAASPGASAAKKEDWRDAQAVAK